MATIIPTTVEEQVRAAAYRWTDYSTADTATPVKLQNMQGLAGAVQVTGTFGGATIALQVSNDGTNFVTLKDGTGAAISFTAAGFAEFSTAALFIKPTSSGGTADNVTVTVVLRGNPMNMPLALLNRRRRIGGFSPNALFALAEPGVWFDPSDLTTLFQDTAGTQPVTGTGQSVALMLDKSKGLVLGPELVTNGDFSVDANWTKNTGWTIGSGVASFNGGGGVSLLQNCGLEANKTYLITITVTTISSGAFRILCGFDTASPNMTAAGTYTFRLLRGTNAFIYVQSQGTTVGSIDNISVKELPGNHAVQATTANRPIYGIHPFGGRRNLLTWSEDLTNAVWGKTRTTVSGTKVSADSTADTSHSINFSGLTYSGVQSTVSFDASAAEISLMFVQMGSAAIAGFNLSAGTLTSYSLGAPTSTITSLGSGLYRCTMTVTPSSNNLIFFLGEGDGSTLDSTLAGTRTGQGLNLNRVQLETGSTATAYQRVTDQYNVTEAGVSSVSYLFFDGVNDSLATSTITPGVDKAQVFAGVRKLSDAATGMLLESSTNSTTSAGTIYFLAPGTVPDYYVFRSGGGTRQSTAATNAGFAAPSTNVLTGIGDIAGDNATIRVNGAQSAQNTGDQGTGNFLAYPLYIGARAGTSLFFSGHLYSLIARFGPNLATGQISSTETWVAGKTGITI